ncbi:MAG: HAD family phosphatase [Pseudomonadota bacterium]
MARWQAFFFDFDGVLADSVEIKTRAFARMFEPHGEPIRLKVIEHHRNNGGMTRRDKFSYYYREFLGKTLNSEELDRLCNRFAVLVVDEVVAAPEIPGATAFLEDWYKEVACFVISAAPEGEIREIIRRRSLVPYFKEIGGAPVTKEIHLKSLLRQYGFDAAGCVYFGDAETDYTAAKTAGINFVAVLPSSTAPLLEIAPQLRWAKDFISISKDLDALLPKSNP